MTALPHQPADGLLEYSTLPGEDLAFPTLVDFVRDWVARMWRHREIDGTQTFWAPDWWRYDEAVVRLEAMWRTWEACRTDPGIAMSMWLREQGDYHMEILMSPRGPFGGNHDITSDRGEPLPHQDPPPPAPALAAPPAARPQDPGSGAGRGTRGQVPPYYEDHLW